MDSLTQIVLGAACGEIVLGKKIGNKALLFGAIGGTIPDLDVFIGKLLYANEIQAMAFHRGFMHSILFAFIGAFIFGWIAYKLYNTGKRTQTTTQKDWIWLFFLSIFTHPILDCFTPYGTQLFAPFSDYRIAFNNISVVDPLYTLPFLICVIVVLFFKRKNPKRLLWTKAGIYISATYMLFTIANKFYMNSIFQNSFKKANIAYIRFSSQPTIFNNILWYAVAEDKNNYYATFYSLFDSKNYTGKILTIPKNHDLLNMEEENLKILTWFSNDYYNIYKKEKVGTYKYVDLRYPMINPEDINTSVFNFTIFFENEEWDILPFDGTPPNKEDFAKFTERFWGI
ncbi:metal-dependent hydrolase [Polaribacter aestuariivivens]|uniref:Metal-dependent hydrolase n=1 Tax=Polaribacter aestuariivivens TaxID=2304626 RepID=A0A5S3N318_9FLAO|nr:metal-dependent hydrolase [Polaribacter aestuariivivens]TMM29623.1 metal-dependent hydrolase [Polaribacter aestuariivivens]